MHLDTVTEKAEPERPGPSRGSMFTHWPGRFRVALSRTRPYILAAAATYVGAVLVSFIVVFSLPEPVRDGLFSPGRGGCSANRSSSSRLIWTWASRTGPTCSGTTS
jgi:hypothetical protein